MKMGYNNFLLKLTLLFFFSASNVFSQEIEWQKSIGGSSGDIFTSIQQTADGGFILGGFSISDSSGDKTENCLGNNDYWIVKTDSTGNVKWDKTIGGDFADFLYTVRQTTDGGYILGGYSKSNISGDKTENSKGNYDYWIVKTDSVGNVQWENTIGGGGLDELYSIRQTTDGGFVLGGTSSSPATGDKTENSKGGGDYWIVKTDALGSIQWQNTIGGNCTEYLKSIEQTNDGGYILGGYSCSTISGDKSEVSLGYWDYWIVKTDSIGNIQWQNTINADSSDLLLSIQQTVDGGYILGGYSDSGISGDKVESSLGGNDYWIIKTDITGNIQWQNVIGGSSDDKLYSIQQTYDEGYILSGFSKSDSSGDKTENRYGFSHQDYWVVKTNALGTIQWQKTIGGISPDELYSTQQTLDGGFVLGGFSWSDSSGNKTVKSNGATDFWILKLTDHYNFITGRLFADLNSNWVLDSGESIIPSLKITEQNSGRFTFSNQNGDYSVSVFDTGTFLVSSQSLIWWSSAPVLQIAMFSGFNQTDSLNDFAFQPLGVFEDVCVTITPLGNFRSGFNASYMINFRNYGTTTVTPTVYFYPYSNVTFLSATLTPNNVTPDSVVWNLPALSPFQGGSIIVTVNVNLGLSNGTLINSSAHIEPYLTDDNPSCNNSNWEVYTTGSFDPNDILVSEDTLTTTQLSNAPWLDYIIRFQNTGNDTAFTVKILNPIDTNKLNISTIEFVNASHPINLNWINYQRNMEFKFENILLVDSNTNEPLSHGFVHYRIQPKANLIAGDSITNFAAIYFDFNEPVITNTAKTIIILPTGIASTTPARGKLHVFPNPTESTLNISGINLENGKAQLRLTDIYGKLILEKTITTTTSTLETTQLSNGIYLIQSGELRATFVKQ